MIQINFKFFVNDFDWTSKEIFLNSGLNTKILANIKNINYEVKILINIRKYQLVKFWSNRSFSDLKLV